MKYLAVFLLFIGLALAAPKQNPFRAMAGQDDCLHCAEDIVNAVADCEVKAWTGVHSTLSSRKVLDHLTCRQPRQSGQDLAS